MQVVVCHAHQQARTNGEPTVVDALEFDRVVGSSAVVEVIEVRWMRRMTRTDIRIAERQATDVVHDAVVLTSVFFTEKSPILVDQA